MEKKTSLLQFTLTYGAILGIVSIIFSVIMYITGYMPYNFKRMGLTFLINLVILIIFLVVGTRTYRDKLLDGTISYGKALLVAILIVAFSTVIGSVYTLVFNAVIDPEYMDKVFEATKSSMYDSFSNMGLPDAQIEDSIDRIEKQQAAYTPMKSFFQAISYSLIFGFIVSLITSAFVTKKPQSVD